MAFSNNRLLFVPMGRGFSIGNSGTMEPLTLHHKQTISSEEMHTLITFMVSIMASNTVDGLYRIHKKFRVIIFRGISKN